MVCIDIETDTLEQSVLEEDKAIIMFSASWCGPCKMIKIIYDELSNNNNNNNINFYIVDIDDRDTFAKKFNIRSVPTFITIKNKQIFNMSKGANIKSLENIINELK